jgi:hypothetical protein
MPGRPRTTLKLLTELLRRAEAHGSELYDLMPKQCHERPDLDDPTCLAWRQAGQAAVQNCLVLDALRAHVAEKVARADQRTAIMETDRR